MLFLRERGFRANHVGDGAMPSMFESVVPFLFCVRCDCNRRKDYEHLLCLSSLSFFYSAHVAFQHGLNVMGILGGALGISSFLYHATHNPSIRSADIMILWAAAGSGLVQGLVGLWYCGIARVHCLWWALSAWQCLVSCRPIQYSTSTKPPSGFIDLRYHFLIHVVGSGSFLALVRIWELSW